LKYARLLSSEEAMRLISDLRLGVALNIIPGIRVSLLNELMVKIRPAFLNKISGQEMMPPERKVYRAGLVRKELGGVPC
jgi:protein arginine kinase